MGVGGGGWSTDQPIKVVWLSISSGCMLIKNFPDEINIGISGLRKLFALPSVSGHYPVL